MESRLSYPLATARSQVRKLGLRHSGIGSKPKESLRESIFGNMRRRTRAATPYYVQRFRQATVMLQPVVLMILRTYGMLVTGELESPPLRHSSDIVHAVFSLDGKRLATSSFADKKACIWEIASAREHWDRIKTQQLQSTNSEFESKGLAATYTFEHTGRVNQSTFSADGNYLVTVSEDETARVWSLASDGESAAVFKHVGVVQNAWFTADGNGLVTVSQNRWPQRSQWRLKFESDKDLPFSDQRKLRDCFRLLCASNLNAEKAIMQALSPENSVNAIEADRADEAERLWQSCREYLVPKGIAPPTHLQLSEACEASGQWFASAWHLEKAILELKSGQSSSESRHELRN